MKIGLIAHGALPVPPRDWGAVEGTLWQRKRHLEQLGHTVDIANTRSIQDVIYAANRRGYDFVHCHCEAFVLECVAHLTRPFAVTSHFGGLHRFSPESPDAYEGFQYFFRDTLQAPALIVLSERIRQLYLRSGYAKLLRVLPNAVEVDDFHWSPRGNGKAVCVGVLSSRKRQAFVAEVVRDGPAVDFVGPRRQGHDGGFIEHETARYLGVWDKQTLYEHLTDYSCLVLLSESEAAPKVVLEACAAGLSVVISEACTANLSAQPFITVLPDGLRDPHQIAQAIQAAIDANPSHRAAIRHYAKDRFDYPVVTRDYLRIIDEVREYTP